MANAVAEGARQSGAHVDIKRVPETARGCPRIVRSVEECREALLHAVGDIERQSLDGGGRVHTAGGDPDAAIDDEQVLHVVAAAPFVHH